MGMPVQEIQSSRPPLDVGIGECSSLRGFLIFSSSHVTALRRGVRRCQRRLTNGATVNQDLR